jgi:hypothetical protein
MGMEWELTYCSPAPVQHATRKTTIQHFDPAERTQIKRMAGVWRHGGKSCAVRGSTWAKGTHVQAALPPRAHLNCQERRYNPPRQKLRPCDCAERTRAQRERGCTAPPHPSNMPSKIHHASKLSRPAEHAKINRAGEAGGNSRCSAPPHPFNMPPATPPRQHFGPAERAQIKRMGTRNQQHCIRPTCQQIPPRKQSRPAERAQTRRTREAGGNSRRWPAPPHPLYMPGATSHVSILAPLSAPKSNAPGRRVGTHAALLPRIHFTCQVR